MGLFAPAAFAALSKNIGFLRDPFGTKAQIEGLRGAGRVETAAQGSIEALQEQILGTTAPFRELGAEQIPLLREQALREPGTGAQFERTLERGTGQLLDVFGPRGLAGSGAEATALGEFGATAVSQDIAQTQALQERLAGFGQAGFGQAIGLEQLLAQLAGQRAQTQAGIGAVRGAGRFATTQAILDLLGSAAGGAIGGAPSIPSGGTPQGGGGGAGGI